MDLIKALEQGIRASTLIKSLVISGIALTLYDYLLMIEDEVRYVWRRRKTPVSSFYILNRIALTACRLWEIYMMSSPKGSNTKCLAEYHAGAMLLTFFLCSSDVFIILRIYAITFGNKILAAYFGIMALTRLVVSLASTFLRPATILAIPPLPIDSFNVCPVVTNLQFKSVPIAIATAFDLSAFLVVAWCAYRNISTVKLSVVVRTIVAEATMYFLAMVAVQIYVQLSYVFTKGTSQEAAMVVYGVLNPILTMRFALSLKRSGDSRQGLKSSRVTSINFADFGSDPPSGAQASAACEGIGLVPVHTPEGGPQTHELSGV